MAEQIVVADVSRWQGEIDFDVFKNHVQGVVIKATGSDGGLYTDSKLARNQSEARRVGLPAWYYHYKGSESPEAQAEYMLGAVGNLQAGEALVIDDENEIKVNVDFCNRFAAHIKKLVGLTVPVYSNLSRLQAIDLAPIAHLPAWVAKYGANGGTVASAGAAPAGLVMPIVMWQYTSTARVPGVSANTVDMNIFYGSVEDFKALGAKGTVPVPAIVPDPVPAPTTGNGTYIVQSGDTLSGIGAKLGQDWAVIAATNGIFAPYTIYPGQKLNVFGGAMNLPTATTTTYTVVKGDTLSGIGIKTGLNWQTLATVNGIKSPYTIYPGQQLKLSGKVDVTSPTYTVVSGDSLSVIGSKTGVDWRVIANLNGIAAPYTIYPNQVLRLS